MGIPGQEPAAANAACPLWSSLNRLTFAAWMQGLPWGMSWGSEQVVRVACLRALIGCCYLLLGGTSWKAVC